MPNLAIPETPEQLRDMLLDAPKVKQLYQEGSLASAVAGYVNAMGKDADLKSQITAEVQRVSAEFFRENGFDAGSRPSQSVVSSLVTNKCYSKTAPGAKIDEVYAGDHKAFLKDTWYRNRHGEAARDRIQTIMDSYGSSIPSDGGFLIPETLRSEILRVSLETAIVRPRARVIPMDSLTVPFPTIDSTTNAGSVYGGISFSWQGEGDDLSADETSSKFGQILLKANKFTGYTAVPNELYMDSIVSMQAFLDQIFPEAYAFQEDMAFMHGTGVGQPIGLLTAKNTAAISVTKQGGQVADSIVWENIVKMYSRMLPSGLGRAVWVAHIDTFPELATMALSVGTGGGPIWLTNGANGSPLSILGRPVYFTEKANTVGDAGDINFIDFGYYMIGDRQTMTAATSAHYLFPNDKTALRWISRVDGRPWIKNAMTPAKGSTTLSPFVKIEARA